MRHPHRSAMSIAADGRGMPASSLALGFPALICGTVVGFELTLYAEARNEADFGYPEALSGPVSSSSAVPQADVNWCSISAVGVQKCIDDASEAIRQTNVTRNPSVCRLL
jgi:hypothetical protein